MQVSCTRFNPPIGVGLPPNPPKGGLRGVGLKVPLLGGVGGGLS